MSELILGQKVRYLPQPEWGVGHLLRLEDNDTKALVVFPARDGGPILVANRQGALTPVALTTPSGAVIEAERPDFFIGKRTGSPTCNWNEARR